MVKKAPEVLALEVPTLEVLDLSRGRHGKEQQQEVVILMDRMEILMKKEHGIRLNK